MSAVKKKSNKKVAKKVVSQQRKIATKQAIKTGTGVSPISGVAPPADKQFGKEGGNPRHSGAWKKEDTLRFKLQQVAKLDKDELWALLDDKKAGEYEKSVARILLDVAEPQTELTTEERWRILNGLTNQDSGMPKQQVDQTNYEAPAPLSPRPIITEPGQQKPKPAAKRKRASRKK